VNHIPSRSSRKRLRRLIALGGGVLLGATAALTLAAPASAHYPTVTGTAECDQTTGEWMVTWQVANSEDDLTGRVKEVSWTPADTELTGIEVDSVVPKKGEGVLEGTQKVGADQTGASLDVTVKWIRDGRKIVKSDKGEVTFEGECKAPASPSPSPSESASPSAPAESPSVAPSETPVPGGGGGSLPTTGASIGTAVGIAGGLLAIGAVLFYVFRRRRIRFTA
jgi:LPXTG-motif cell wall-anchored protein